MATGGLSHDPGGPDYFMVNCAHPTHIAPGLADEEVRRVSDERDYARRFGATPAAPPT